ncbi:MAG TPA: PAS domain S-box protein [Gemmatimonadaceae bacterium]
MEDATPPVSRHTGDTLVQWRRFIGALTPDAALRPVILESWRRCHSAGVDPRATHVTPHRVPDDELQRRLAANAELIELARPHLEWLSAACGAIPHVAYVVDRDGIVLHSTGTDAESMRAIGLLPGYDWSEAAMGTNGAGTALVTGEPVVVEGAEHYTRPFHAYTCTGAPVRGVMGEVVGAIDISTGTDQDPANRIMTVAHAAYALGQELRYRDSLRRTTGHLEAERRMAEAVRESEERFRVAFDQAAIGMAITSAEGRWLKVNRALCDILGYTEGELLASTFQDVTHPDDVPRSVAVLRRAVAGELDRYQLEKRYIHKRGHTVWVALNVAVVRDAGRDAPYVLAQMQDITERKQAEAALRESEARYEQIAAQAPGIVYQFVHRPDGSAGFTFVSEGAHALFGVSAEVIRRDPAALYDLIHPDDRPGFHASRTTAVATLAPWRWEGRAVLPTGEEKWVQVASRQEQQPDGSILSAGLLVDITEQRRAAQRLEESEQHYRSLFDQNPDAIFSLDTDGRFLSANPACEVVSGYRPDELIGESFAALVVPEDLEVANASFGSAVAGEATRYEASIRHRSGRRVRTGVTNVPIIVGGCVVGVFGIAKDRSVQHELEEQLRQAQKLEAVGRLAGGIAHDFNNLLLVIQSYGAFATEQLSVGSPVRADLGEILKAADRAAALTGQLLAFSRQQVLQPSRLDVNEIVSGVATMLRRVIGEDIMLETELAPSLWPVHADPGQLEQVILNLAVNARDAMPRGGTLRLRTTNVSVGPTAARVRPGLEVGEYVSLTVEDTGVGISPAVLPNIFEPFYTTKGTGKGTGLGLATAYGIVTQSDGYIFADSTPGEGSRFTVLLPRVAGAQPNDAGGPAASTSPGGTETILLVEDDTSVRTVVRRQLEQLGYRVRAARNGFEALEIAAAAERIDLVLTDVVMPELGGRELVDRLRARRPALRVVYMSGYTDDEILRRGVMQSGTAFLEKPFTQPGLASAIRHALDARP